MSDADRTPPLPFVTDVTVQPGDVVFATDRRGQLVHWNKEAEQLFGYAASEVIGNPFDIICLGAPGGSGIDLRTILAGRDFAGGVRCFDKSGREIALYVYATAGRKPSGTAAGVVFVARDVSEFWRAEQAVRTAEDKYQMLFEHSSDAVAIADIAGRVLEVNPALLRLYGYTADEARGMRLADSVATESRAEADKAMADLAAGETVTRTIKMTRKDGTRFVVDLVASVVSVKGARRILSVTRDVTERVRAEEATNESERKYRAVFESANDAVLLETVDGRILDVNENACVLLGYTKKELLALGVSDLVPPEARAWLPRVTDAILQDRTFRAEAVNVHKSGRHIPVEISASTMQVDDRTLVLAIVRDISERKRAEAALAESENRYRTLFNDSLMGIYRTSPDGQIQLANPALIRMLGYESFARLAERNLETAGSGPEYRRDEFKRRLERDGRIVGLEARWQTRDGRTLFVRESAHAVRGPDGAVLYYEGTVEDISDRRAAEQAARERRAVPPARRLVAGRDSGLSEREGSNSESGLRGAARVRQPGRARRQAGKRVREPRRHGDRRGAREGDAGATGRAGRGPAADTVLAPRRGVDAGRGCRRGDHLEGRTRDAGDGARHHRTQRAGPGGRGGRGAGDTGQLTGRHRGRMRRRDCLREPAVCRTLRVRQPGAGHRPAGHRLSRARGPRPRRGVLRSEDAGRTGADPLPVQRTEARQHAD
jgi:PAS domain S-box-containing protein